MIRLLGSIAIAVSMMSGVPGEVAAHSASASLEQSVGSTTIDIGYRPSPIQAGEATMFVFELYNDDKTREREFARVWTRLEREQTVSLATGIGRPPIGNTTLLYTFPEAGTYTLNVRYQDGDATVASTTFPVEVQPSPSAERGVQGDLWWYLGAGLFVLLGGIGGYALVRRR